MLCGHLVADGGVAGDLIGEHPAFKEDGEGGNDGVRADVVGFCVRFGGLFDGGPNVWQELDVRDLEQPRLCGYGGTADGAARWGAHDDTVPGELIVLHPVRLYVTMCCRHADHRHSRPGAAR